MSRRSLLQKMLVAAAVAGPAAMLASHGAVDAASLIIPRSWSRRSAAYTVAGDPKSAYTAIQVDENAHVTFLQGALKSAARPKPTFKGIEQPDIMTFQQTAMALENTGVGAYLLGAGAISSPAILGAAATILTIEARHAGWINVTLDQPIAPASGFDAPEPQAQVVQAASPFIASLNGGPDPSAALANDTDILNFALLLEFLEAEFYNVNVPKFYP